jgi:hypothetical protein
VEPGQVQVEQRQEPVAPPRSAETDPVVLRISYEFRPGLGEDAPPLGGLWSPTNGLVGVFDGLGGAGGETMKTLDGMERPGAWIASRQVAEVVSEHAYLVRGQQGHGAGDDSDQLPALPPPPDFTSTLKREIKSRLAGYAVHARTGGESRLKSKLIKTLPTTMALCWFDSALGEFTAIWAGDSRVYQFRPEADVGLQQVTTDDLKTRADALENLTQDSPMSNFISADTDFVLHERRMALYPRTILLAASDGCFGYVLTPLHFEFMLLSAMQAATSWRDWRDRLTTSIMNVTGDDATLSAVAIGWREFAACQHDFADRYQWCAERVRRYAAKSDRITRLQQELVIAKQELADGRKELWEEYRKSYEVPMHAATRDVAEKDLLEPAPGPSPEAAPGREPEPPPASTGDGAPPAHPEDPRGSHPYDAGAPRGYEPVRKRDPKAGFPPVRSPEADDPR